MSEQDHLIQCVEKFAEELLTMALPDSMYFHNFEHTRLVVNGVQEIGKGSGISEREYLVLIVAAYLHDTGYVQIYMDHESVSMEIAHKFLQELTPDEAFINEVLECIRATRYPHQPDTLLQQIICDADFYHFSIGHYDQFADALRREWENRLGKAYSEREWDELNLRLLGTHQYFTPYARTILQKRKEENIRKLSARLI